MALKRLSAAIGIILSISPLRAADTEPRTAAFGEASLLNKIDEIPGMLSAGKITPEQIPNPHWRKDACLSCHRVSPSAGDTALRGKDIDQLCQTCHAALFVNDYHHAFGMKPSAEKRKRMPGPFRQALKRGGGVVTCIVCHDVHMQGKEKRAGEWRDNPLFFRTGPFMKRTDLCFSCHNPEHYEQLNPHDQITDEGGLNKTVCLVCHSIAPNRRNVKSIDDVVFSVTEDLTRLCTGCHVWRPHPAQPLPWEPSGPNHLVKPSEEILKQMKATEKRDNVILPLEPASGRIFCATCHNPHERGVQREEKADRGADAKNRLRRATESIMCMSCHNV